MPFDLERDDELVHRLESEVSDDELKDRLREHPVRVNPTLESVLVEEPDEK